MKKLSIITLLIFSLLLAACSTTNTQPTSTETANSTSENQDTGGDFIIGSTGSPTTFNSLYSFDTASGNIIGFLFNGLLKSNEKSEYSGDLAESWSVSEDGLTWTFNLKKGVKFHDGVELTAEDVVFTYSIPLHNDYDGPRGTAFEKIETITAVDPYTVEIKLSQQYAPFLGTATYSILPKHILGDVPVADLGKHSFNTQEPVGTGPFSFVEWKSGQYVKVKANEDYFDGRASFDTITYKIVPDGNALLAQLAAGDVHHISVQPTDLETVKALEQQGKVSILSGLARSYTYIGWNQLNPLFQDKKVRQALSHAVDRHAILEGALNGEGELANLHGSPTIWSYDPDVPVFDYDPEKAKQLLAEAGWKDTDNDGILDKDGKPFEFFLNTSQGNKVREQSIVLIQEDLKEVGIHVKPRILEFSAFVNNNMDRNYEAALNGWNLGSDPDPTSIFHSDHAPTGLNYTNYINKEVDQLIEENVKALDQAERQKILSEIHRKISDDQPYTFLFYPNNHFALASNVSGVIYHPGNPFFGIDKWSYKK